MIEQLTALREKEEAEAAAAAVSRAERAGARLSAAKEAVAAQLAAQRVELEVCRAPSGQPPDPSPPPPGKHSLLSTPSTPTILVLLSRATPAVPHPSPTPFPILPHPSPPFPALPQPSRPRAEPPRAPLHPQAGFQATRSAALESQREAALAERTKMLEAAAGREAAVRQSLEALEERYMDLDAQQV